MMEGGRMKIGWSCWTDLEDGGGGGAVHVSTAGNSSSSSSSSLVLYWCCMLLCYAVCLPCMLLYFCMLYAAFLYFCIFVFVLYIRTLYIIHCRRLVLHCPHCTLDVPHLLFVTGTRCVGYWFRCLYVTALFWPLPHTTPPGRLFPRVLFIQPLNLPCPGVTAVDFYCYIYSIFLIYWLLLPLVACCWWPIIRYTVVLLFTWFGGLGSAGCCWSLLLTHWTLPLPMLATLLLYITLPFGGWFWPSPCHRRWCGPRCCYLPVLRYVLIAHDFPLHVICIVNALHLPIYIYVATTVFFCIVLNIFDIRYYVKILQYSYTVFVIASFTHPSPFYPLRPTHTAHCRTTLCVAFPFTLCGHAPHPPFGPAIRSRPLCWRTCLAHICRPLRGQPCQWCAHDDVRLPCSAVTFTCIYYVCCALYLPGRPAVVIVMIVIVGTWCWWSLVGRNMWRRGMKWYDDDDGDGTFIFTLLPSFYTYLAPGWWLYAVYNYYYNNNIFTALLLYVLCVCGKWWYYCVLKGGGKKNREGRKRNGMKTIIWCIVYVCWYGIIQLLCIIIHMYLCIGNRDNMTYGCSWLVLYWWWWRGDDACIVIDQYRYCHCRAGVMVTLTYLPVLACTFFQATEGIVTWSYSFVLSVFFFLWLLLWSTCCQWHDNGLFIFLYVVMAFCAGDSILTFLLRTLTYMLVVLYIVDDGTWAYSPVQGVPTTYIFCDGAAFVHSTFCAILFLCRPFFLYMPFVLFYSFLYIFYTFPIWYPVTIVIPPLPTHTLCCCGVWYRSNVRSCCYVADALPHLPCCRTPTTTFPTPTPYLLPPMPCLLIHCSSSIHLHLFCGITHSLFVVVTLTSSTVWLRSSLLPWTLPARRRSAVNITCLPLPRRLRCAFCSWCCSGSGGRHCWFWRLFYRGELCLRLDTYCWMVVRHWRALPAIAPTWRTCFYRLPSSFATSAFWRLHCVGGWFLVLCWRWRLPVVAVDVYGDIPLCGCDFLRHIPVVWYFATAVHIAPLPIAHTSSGLLTTDADISLVPLPPVLLPATDLLFTFTLPYVPDLVDVRTCHYYWKVRCVPRCYHTFVTTLCCIYSLLLLSCCWWQCDIIPIVVCICYITCVMTCCYIVHLRCILFCYYSDNFLLLLYSIMTWSFLFICVCHTYLLIMQPLTMLHYYVILCVWLCVLSFIIIIIYVCVPTLCVIVTFHLYMPLFLLYKRKQLKI